ncbi:MAG: hypothetical protein PGN29_16570 [Gordonia paraffinivorans]
MVATSLGVLGATAVVAGTGPAAAAPVPRPLPVTQFVVTGDPWPFSVETFSTAPAGAGHTRVVADPLCNAFNRSLCLGYTKGASISWVNLTTGRSGLATIPDTAVPGSSVDIATGSGPVAFRVGSVRDTIVPAVGVVVTP